MSMVQINYNGSSLSLGALQYLRSNIEVAMKLPEPGKKWVASDAGLNQSHMRKCVHYGIVQREGTTYKQRRWEAKESIYQLRQGERKDIPQPGIEFVHTDVEPSYQQLAGLRDRGYLRVAAEPQHVNYRQWSTNPKVGDAIQEMKPEDVGNEPRCPSCAYRGFENKTGVVGLTCKLCDETHPKEEWKNGA